MKRRLQNDLGPALGFLLPNFLGFVIFTAFPVLFSLGAAFTNWDLQHIFPLAFIGTENFRRLFYDAFRHRGVIVFGASSQPEDAGYDRLPHALLPPQLHGRRGSDDTVEEAL